MKSGPQRVPEVSRWKAQLPWLITWRMHSSLRALHSIYIADGSGALELLFRPHGPGSDDDQQ